MKQNKKEKALKENVASWNGSRSGEDFLCKKFLNCTVVIKGNKRITGSSAKEIGQVKSFWGYYKRTQKKQISQSHFKFEPMWLFCLSFICTYKSVYRISSYHQNSANFRVRRLGKETFPAGQGFDDWQNTSKLALHLSEPHPVCS